MTAFLGISTPGFFVALGLIYLMAVRLGWFPTSGIRSPLKEPSLFDHLHYLILPAAALAIEYVAGMMRQARASMLEALNQDYIVTARAKGLRERTVVYRHALRNAALPLVTLFGLYLPGLIGGSIIIETIFGWPGMGSLAIDAVHGRDYNMLMAINMVGATMVLVDEPRHRHRLRLRRSADHVRLTRAEGGKAARMTERVSADICRRTGCRGTACRALLVARLLREGHGMPCPYSVELPKFA